MPGFAYQSGMSRPSCHIKLDSVTAGELDAVGRQFEPYPYRRMRLNAVGAPVV